MNKEDFKSPFLKAPVCLSDKFFELCKDLPPPIDNSYKGTASFRWEIPEELDRIDGAWYEVGAVFDPNGSWIVIFTSNPLTRGSLQYSIKDYSKISYDEILYWCLLKMDGFVRGMKGDREPPYHSDDKFYHDIWEHYLMGALINNKPIKGAPIKSILEKSKDKCSYDRFDSCELLLLRAYKKDKLEFFKSLSKYMDPQRVYNLGVKSPKFLELAVQGGLDMRSLKPIVSKLMEIVSKGPTNEK